MLQLERRLGYLPRHQMFSESLYGLERNSYIFYTGDSHRMIMPRGSIGKLSIRDFPTMQLHIHEDASGRITGANIKGKGEDGGSIPLTNCEAIMADYYAKALGFSRKVAVQLAIERARGSQKNNP